jgi:hypothetical protein
MIWKRMVWTVLLILLGSGSALAVPETVSVRVTDVTPTSFAVVWMTDVAAEPAVQIYQEASGANEITGSLRLTPMPDAAPAVAAAARQKGIMKVRVSGLAPQTTCYVRTVTADPANPQSVGYSAPQAVTTAALVEPFTRQGDGTLTPAANDLLAFPVYIRPGDQGELPGRGDLLLIETSGSYWPLSAFAGEGVAAPEGLLDLNNLFDFDGKSLDLSGGEKATLRIYRGGTLSTLLHYRSFPTDSGAGAVGEAVRGFFADVNIDGRVDETDFEQFKAQYRQGAGDAAFNPDFNFIAVQEGSVETDDRIDARDFARFAPEFGRTNVE